jgi:hypothetical protein
MIIAGIDVSKASVTVCLLENIPSDMKAYAKTYKALVFKATEIDKLLALKFDAAVLEPTGGHYSRLWAERIKQSGRKVRWVGHQEVAGYRKSYRLPDKTDKTDGLALACYGLERWENVNYFLTERAELPLRLRELCLQLQFLNHSATPMINRLRQQLAHEWPEVANKSAARHWLAPPQGLWMAIANEAISKKWQRELDQSQGLGLSLFSRDLGIAIVANERAQIRIEAELEQILRDEDLQRYLECMDRFNFGRRTSCALLSAIYPIEKFNGHRNPLGAFKLCCGMAQVWVQSGDYTGWIPGGSSDIRKALWFWSLSTMGQRRQQRATTPEIEQLRDYYKNGSVVAGEHLDPGRGNQRLMRVARRALTMLYRDLKKLKTTSL